MFISRVSEKESVMAGEMEIVDNSNEFQMADEIYNIMSKNSAFEVNGLRREEALTNSDLVILYKKIDMDTKLAPNTKEQARKSSNQYVETVIYHDDRRSEESDVSEEFSYEDCDQVITVNNERIDLINKFGDTLCHKYGDIEMGTSGLTTEYDKHFMFNNAFIQDQLNSFHPVCKSEQSDSTILPTSFLDYICFKRLEDNCNLYMDNIIKYVQNTIEQLKRISNGDYLTEKAKAKWREIDGENKTMSECKTTALANTVTRRIQLDVENFPGSKITWDDVFHSEMDVRSLTKILEKKVLLEVPTIICGTYTLFSKRYKHNLIIKCKKDKRTEKESRIDVVLKLQRPQSRHVISNIDDSIVILEPSTARIKTETWSPGLLAIEYKKAETTDQKIEQKDIDLDQNNEEPPPKYMAKSSEADETEADKVSESECDLSSYCNCDADNDNDDDFSPVEDNNGIEIATDDLRCTIQRLSMQSPVIEENEENIKKKKSSLKVRIKSPYENKSYVLDEKKRKKLLEIREKREVKKIAMSEKRKMSKKKHERSAVAAQASNSVTKLSITNKHFYNSIYGESMNTIKKNLGRHKDLQNTNTLDIKLEDNEKACKEPSRPPTPTKYSNRSYYLDNVDTEIRYLETKEHENQVNQSLSRADLATPTETDEINVKLDLLKQLIVPSTTELIFSETLPVSPVHVSCDSSFNRTEKENVEQNILTSTQSIQVVVPPNSPKKEVFTETENGHTVSSVDCRKSIDKIYDLIKKISDTNSLANTSSKSKIASNITELGLSDSGTSIKRQIASSYTDSLDLDSKNTLLILPNKKNKYEKSGSGNVISKITISSKSYNTDNANYRENSKLNFGKNKDNPLKAISQLIRKIDNVQTMNNKNGNDIKRNKKYENLSTLDRSDSRHQIPKRVPKKDRNLKDSELNTLKFSVPKERTLNSPENRRFKTTKQLQSVDIPLDTTNRKKIADIIDEVKELRGEAVRGPPKKLNRLNNLAQPKKTYNETLKEECQNKFGRRTIDRPSKPNSPLNVPGKGIPSVRNKQKKVPDVSVKPPNTVGPPLERSLRDKPSSNNSPSRNRKDKHSPVSVDRGRCNPVITKKTPDVRNGKMATTEIYVKTNSKCESQRLELGDSKNSLKSKVLKPNDLDSLLSMSSSPFGDEASADLGQKLHSMIDDVVNRNMPVLRPTPLTECNESFKLGTGLNDDISGEGRTRSDVIVLSVSDYPLDIFEDKNIITAVSSISKDNNEAGEELVHQSQSETISDDTKLNNQPYTPIKLSKPKQSLYYQISNGELKKPLQFNNINVNLSSKQSTEKDPEFRLASGDISSVVLKPKIASNMKYSTDKVSVKETLSEMLPFLTNNRIDFGLTKFPMQIATIGYALPHYYKSDSTSKIRILERGTTLQNCKSKNETKIFFRKSEQSIRCVKEPEEMIVKTESVVNKETPPNFEILVHAEESEQALRCVNQETIEKSKSKINNESPAFIDVHPFDKPQEKQNKGNIIETAENIADFCAVDIKSSNISNSTSLDILLGLLNEIKKITSFETNIPKQDDIGNNACRDTELEIILNKVAVKESSIDHNLNNTISLPSIDNLQILKACNSNFPYIPNVHAERSKTKIDKKITTTTSLHYICSTLNVKKVTKDVSSTKFVHRYTDAPSRCALLSVSTGVTDSLVKLITKSSSLSMYSFIDCDSSTFSKTEDIIEIPPKISTKDIDNVCHSQISNIEDHAFKKNIADIKPLSEHNYSTEFDSVMKMKRDILVTFYSILVLTVFTALSFPDIIYRVY